MDNSPNYGEVYNPDMIENVKMEDCDDVTYPYHDTCCIHPTH